MKKLLSKIACMVVTGATVVSFSMIPSFAAELTGNEATREIVGYTPTADSTWGDLYRYFDPEGFAALTADEKYLFDSILLDDNNVETSATGKVDVVVDSGRIEGYENQVSVTGYIYSDDEQTRAVNIEGLVDFKLGVSSTKDSIDHTAVITSTVRCPKLYINTSLYDPEEGRYVSMTSGSEENAKVCTLSDTFDGLESKKTYTVKSIATITPPDGYFIDAPLVIQYNQDTK